MPTGALDATGCRPGGVYRRFNKSEPLEQVLRIYVKHYNEHRPHRALGLEAPDPPTGLAVGEDEPGWVRRRDLLSGLLREYHRAA